MESRTEPVEREPDITVRKPEATAVRKPDTSARPPLVRELLLVVGLFLVYKFGRQLANGHTGEAFRNAHRVWDAERTLRLPGEGAVQHALLSSDTLIHFANTYYASVHFPATLLFLVWLYLRRPRHYVWTRRVLAALTAAALVLHLGFPLAPPRMLDASAPRGHGTGVRALGVRRQARDRHHGQPVRGHALAALRLGADAGHRHDRRDLDAVALAVAAAPAGHAAGDRRHREPLLARRARGDRAARRRPRGRLGCRVPPRHWSYAAPHPPHRARGPRPLPPPD